MLAVTACLGSSPGRSIFTFKNVEEMGPLKTSSTIGCSLLVDQQRNCDTGVFAKDERVVAIPKLTAARLPADRIPAGVRATARHARGRKFIRCAEEKR
jgi:hypothetical protein